MFAALKPGGHLYIADTPNRLWPVDLHTTGLWWVPWCRPGSERAYRYAVRRGQHLDTHATTPGPRGLEERGAWGATYWEILGYLEPGTFQCLNRQPGHGRRIHNVHRTSRRRAAVGYVLRHTVARLWQAPVVAFTPFIANLVTAKL